MTHGRRIAKRQCVVVRPTFINISQSLVTPTWRPAGALQNVSASLCAQLSSRTLEGRCTRCRLVQPLFSMPTYSRYIFATRALEVRQVCAGCSLHLRRTHSEYPASVLRVSGVGPARSARVWCPSGVCTHASSSAHSFEHAQKVRRTQRMTTNRYGMLSVLDERATNADAHPAMDSALAKMNDFFRARAVRCVGQWLVTPTQRTARARNNHSFWPVRCPSLGVRQHSSNWRLTLARSGHFS